MFDMTGMTDPSQVNLRCFYHPEWVETMESYLDRFASLRPTGLAETVLAMIVGVPPDVPECIGLGEGLDGCLGRPEMEERPNPDHTGYLQYACHSELGSAAPARRYVRLAQEWDKRGSAWVDSICKDDWSDTMRAITAQLVANLDDDRECLPEAPRFEASACMADCFLVETLNDGRSCGEDPSCPAAWCPSATAETLDVMEPCREPVDGTVCTPLYRDLGTEGPRGFERRRCLVRQALRNPFVERCGEPLEDGWTYVPAEWGECAELRVYREDGEALTARSSTLTLRCRR
jgi:hypothetical protein